MFIASRKGFSDGRWFFAVPPIGFVVVCCLPSAKKRGISYRRSADRRKRADAVGSALCLATVVLLAISALVGTFLSVNKQSLF